MKTLLHNHDVAVQSVDPGYPSTPPFDPSVSYPEYQGRCISTQPNSVYEGIRNLLFLLGMDKEHFGTPEWNPLSAVIRPGDSVLIKPNIVRHYNPLGHDTRSLITHGSVVRAVADYALMAMKGQGDLIIGDAPVQSCNFSEAVSLSGLSSVLDYYRSRGIEVRLRDFRLVVSRQSGTASRKQSLGDPSGFTIVDLGEKSLHHKAHVPEKYRVTNYDPAFMQQYHNRENHAYMVANSVLAADVVISLPKLKTHRKAGITVTLKNNVGINVHKDCLPHHTKGSVAEGGDEYLHRSFFKRLAVAFSEFEDVRNTERVRKIIRLPKRVLYKFAQFTARDPYFEGSWYGNQTLFKTVIDLNHILLYAERSGDRRPRELPRRFLSIVDGVIAGEAEGPLAPTPKPAGVIVAGFNPAAVDLICCRLMDFDWHKIPILSQAVRSFASFDPEDIVVFSNDECFRGRLMKMENRSFFSFEAPQGWKGRVELRGGAIRGCCPPEKNKP